MGTITLAFNTLVLGMGHGVRISSGGGDWTVLPTFSENSP